METSQFIERRRSDRRRGDIENAVSLDDIKIILRHIDDDNTEIKRALNESTKNLPAQIELAVQRLLWSFFKGVFKAALTLTLMIPTWVFIFQSAKDGILTTWLKAFTNLF